MRTRNGRAGNLVGIGTGVNARLLRPEEVAGQLAISRVTVHRLARSGELASLRIRGQVRFRQEAVDDFLARAEAELRRSAPRPSPLRGRPRKQWPRDAA